MNTRELFCQLLAFVARMFDAIQLALKPTYLDALDY